MRNTFSISIFFLFASVFVVRKGAWADIIPADPQSSVTPSEENPPVNVTFEAAKNEPVNYTGQIVLPNIVAAPEQTTVFTSSVQNLLGGLKCNVMDKNLNGTSCGVVLGVMDALKKGDTPNLASLLTAPIDASFFIYFEKEHIDAVLKSDPNCTVFAISETKTKLVAFSFKGPQDCGIPANKTCEDGWTTGTFNNVTHCYRAYSDLNNTQPASYWDDFCTKQQSGATAVSIESPGENNLTYSLAIQQNPNVYTIYIGIRLNRGDDPTQCYNTYVKIQNQTWTDGTPIGPGSYGYSTGDQYDSNTVGVAPWGATCWPQQPDNSPITTDCAQCAIMWGNSTVCNGDMDGPLQPGAWDDVPCSGQYVTFQGTVCEYVPKQ